MFIHSSANEFALEARGEDFLRLPDIPIIIEPVVFTSLHEFVRHGEWVFRVKHEMKGRYPSAPKISLRLDRAKHVIFAFKTQACPLLKTPHEAMEVLRQSDYTFRTVDVTMIQKRLSAPRDFP